MKFNITVEYDIDNEWKDLDQTIQSKVVDKISNQLLYNLSGSRMSDTIEESAKGVKRSVANQIAEILRSEIDVDSIEKRIEKKIETDIDKRFIEKYSYKIQKNIEEDLDKKISSTVQKDIKKSISKAFR